MAVSPYGSYFVISTKRYKIESDCGIVKENDLTYGISSGVIGLVGEFE